MSSVKVGRNKDEGTLSEEHYVQEDYTADPFFEDIVDKDAAVTPDFERKSQGYKNLQKLKYPQMKELYDKVQESIKDSFKDFIPMDSEKEREMLKERDAKRLSRKRKATIAEEQSHQRSL
ncbi:hypothetical protein Tco_0147459, partial [Tanacetum coccineum]